ncbi:MAG TPA: hypothetical protein PKA19_15875 [Bacillota bacterium]|nr:hypothetical protein [Bacillota bacterium]
MADEFDKSDKQKEIDEFLNQFDKISDVFDRGLNRMEQHSSESESEPGPDGPGEPSHSEPAESGPGGPGEAREPGHNDSRERPKVPVESRKIPAGAAF